MGTYSFVNLGDQHSVARGSDGAWQKFERGELELFPFYEAFSKDLSDTVNGNIWYQDYCKRKGIGTVSC